MMITSLLLLFLQTQTNAQWFGWIGTTQKPSYQSNYYPNPQYYHPKSYHNPYYQTSYNQPTNTFANQFQWWNTARNKKAGNGITKSMGAETEATPTTTSITITTTTTSSTTEGSGKNLNSIDFFQYRSTQEIAIAYF